MISVEAKLFAKERLAVESDEGVRRIEALAKQRTPRSGRLLIELLEHRIVWIRESALDALWEFGRLEDARKAARIAIHSPNDLVQDMAAEMMGEVGTKADGPALIEIVRAASWEVSRASAATSLGEIRTIAGEKALRLTVVDDPSWMVRAYAAQALTCKGDKRFRPFIEERINRERDFATVAELYACMVDMNCPEYVERIIDLLFDDDHWFMVYLRAAIILDGIFLEEGMPLPNRAVKGLKQVIKYDVGMAAKWNARAVLKKAGINVRVPGPPKAKRKTTSRSSGKKRG